MVRWSLQYSFDVDEKNSVIYVKIHGIWKADTAKNYHEDFKAEAQGIIDRPWAKMIDLTNWKTSFPEVIEVVGQHMDWSRKNNCALSIYVLNHPSTFRQLNEMFAAGNTKEVSLTFRTYAEGEKYLKENWLNKKH
jgi:hypothetical protein